MAKLPIDLDGVLLVSSLGDRAPGNAIDFFGDAVDAAIQRRREDVLLHLSSLANTIERDNAGHVDQTLFDYYLANLWSGIRHLRGPFPSGSWEWNGPEFESEIICIRRAAGSRGFTTLPIFRQCQILTNLANVLSTIGRFVDAIGNWNLALSRDSGFTMALGNRAIALWHYAQSLYDRGHSIVLARQAWHDLDPLSLATAEPGAIRCFAETRAEIESRIPSATLNRPLALNDSPLGNSSVEVAYRTWCLTNRLFLNPLNDVGPYSIAARDMLTVPPIVAPIDEGPRYHGFFNQMKQEFCSSRWLAYEAITSTGTHFSDSGVLLYNTLDYPSYSLATEKLKLAYRSSYSLLDKIAFFLNTYLNLGIPERRVSLKSIWYTGQNIRLGIRREFESRENWPLRGLFWLSKDFYEKRLAFRSAIAPEAQRLSEIRNDLEHKYLKLHTEMHSRTATLGSDSALVDDLATSVCRPEFEAMTLGLFSLIRAAIIYLVLGVHQEERLRAKNRPKTTRIAPVTLDVWEDDWKR